MIAVEDEEQGRDQRAAVHGRAELDGGDQEMMTPSTKLGSYEILAERPPDNVFERSAASEFLIV